MTRPCAGEESGQRVRLFNDGWMFHRGEAIHAEAPEFQDGSWRKLTLPHDFSIEGVFSEKSASCTGYLPGGTGWYRKHFALPDAAAGKRVLVRFEGVYRNSEVWVNGKSLGGRPNGYIDFEYDLTPYLAPAGRENVLAVKVVREEVADSRWYTGTGIYRDVWLTLVDPVHVVLHGSHVTTPAASGSTAEVNSFCEVGNDTDEEVEVRVTATVADADGRELSKAASRHTVKAGGTWNFALYHPVESPRRWSPGDPYLYQITHRVETAGRVADEVTHPFGIRTFRFDPDTGFFLNGSPLLIKGVCNHHDAGNLGAVVPRAVLERRLRILKDIGVNAIRCSHNPMQDDLYDLCDRMGFLVMDEAFDEWELGKRKWVEGRNVGTAARFGYNSAFVEWAVRDIEAMVRRARRHPSVILYSLGNEIDYPTDPYVHPRSMKVEIFKDDPSQPSMNRLAAVAPSLIAAVKRVDPTRPVTMALSNVAAANAIGLASMLDVAGYNYQESRYDEDHVAFPGRVIYGSENGDDVRAWRAVCDKPFVSAQFLWTGFDFLGEAGSWPWHGSTAGLFDSAGFIKPDGMLREALWSENPVLHLVAFRGDGRRGRSHWNEVSGENTPVRVVAFTNLRDVSLELNGRSLGSADPVDGVARWSVPWEKGCLVVNGIGKDGKRVSDQLNTTGPASGLRIEVDRERFVGNGRDAVHVTIVLVDANGLPVPDDDRLVSVTVDRPGRLAALENGDMRDSTPPKSAARETRAGKALAILQADEPAPRIEVRAVSEGLKPASIQIGAIAPSRR